MDRININFETLTDLQLDVQTTITTTGIGKNSVKEKCVCFTISGYNPQTDEDVEEHAVISMSEAQRLSIILAGLLVDEN